jgi:hypothetical protein
LNDDQAVDEVDVWVDGVGGSAEGELDGIRRGSDVDGPDTANTVLRRCEAGAELGGGLANRRRPIAPGPGSVRLGELVEGHKPELLGALDRGHTNLLC